MGGNLLLEHHLAQGYRHAMHGGHDPAADCAATHSTAALIEVKQTLEPVQDRCHISHTRLKFINRVLSLQTAK
jgi:hypothetical protein